MLDEHRLLKDAGYMEEKLAGSFIADCEEIQRLLTASIKTAKANLKKAEGNDRG